MLNIPNAIVSIPLLRLLVGFTPAERERERETERETERERGRERGRQRGRKRQRGRERETERETCKCYGLIMCACVEIASEQGITVSLGKKFQLFCLFFLREYLGEDAKSSK